MPASRLLSLAATTYSTMLAVGLAWGWLGTDDNGQRLLQHWWTFEDGPSIAIGVGAGVLLGLIGVVLAWQLERTVPGIRQLSERFSAILAGLEPRGACILALFSSVGEEVLFRGCLQTQWGLWPATIAFALVHVGPNRTWLWWTFSAFVCGLGLALLYEHQGGLLAPILMHFVINAINITLLARRGASAGTPGTILHS
tara:strand:- start:201 stop:794 length:594 start_codon:yes stop_codon:yes gene_type:complete